MEIGLKKSIEITATALPNNYYLLDGKVFINSEQGWKIMLQRQALAGGSDFEEKEKSLYDTLLATSNYVTDFQFVSDGDPLEEQKSAMSIDPEVLTNILNVANIIREDNEDDEGRVNSSYPDSQVQT